MADTKIRAELELVPKTGDAKRAMRDLTESVKGVGTAAREAKRDIQTMSATEEQKNRRERASFGIGTSWQAQEEVKVNRFLDNALKRMGLNQQAAIEQLKSAKREGTLNEPGKALLDDLVQRKKNQDVDRKGGFSASWTEFASKASVIESVMSKVTMALQKMGDGSYTVSQRIMNVADNLIEAIPVYGSIYTGAKGFMTELLMGGDRRTMTKAAENSREFLEDDAVNRQRRTALMAEEDRRLRVGYEAESMRRMPNGPRGLDMRLGNPRTVRHGAKFSPMMDTLDDWRGVANAFLDPRSPLGQMANAGVALADISTPQPIRDAQERARRAERPVWVAEQELRDIEGQRRLAGERVGQSKRDFEQFGVDFKKREQEYKKQRESLPPWMRGMMPENYGDTQANVFELGEEGIKRRKALEKLQRDEKELEALVNKELAKGVELSTKRFELDKARLDIKKTEVTLLREREAKAASNLESFAGMDEWSRENLGQAYDMAKKMRADELSGDAEQTLLGSPLTADWYRKKRLGEFNQNDPTFQKITGELGLDRFDDVRGLRGKVEEEVKKLEQRYEQAFRESLEQLYKVFSNPLKSLIEGISGTMSDLLQNQRVQEMLQKQINGD
jgi:hypothetical protein